MKILHVITSLRTGGAEHLLVDLLPRLRECGHSVEVLIFDGTRTPFYEQLEKLGVKIYVLGTGYGEMYNPLNYFRLRRFFSKHVYDVVHTHNTPCQLLVAMLRSKYSLRLVTTEHNSTNRRRGWSWYRWIDRWMYRQYDAVACVSDMVRMNLVRSLGDKDFEERLHLIYNGVHMELYKALPKRSVGKTRCIIMVAGFRTQKDQPTLIRAVSVLPNEYRLVLVGNGPCRRSCEELAVSLGVAERVTFAGERTDIPQLLANADVAVLSSHYEGLPLTAIEAMAAGVPLIASDVDGVHEVVEGAGLLFPHQDFRRLAELIENVCANEELRRNVSAKCSKRAEKYDIANTVKAYNEIYLGL
jgi:glycosyltransferase involved in cell wall biosynthesis